MGDSIVRPDPLVAADVDLTDFAFMPLDVRRLRDSDLAALETPEACWFAVLLWSAAWHQVPAASLPNDDRILAQLAGVSRKRWGKVRDGAMRGWVLCSDGRYYHPVIAEKAMNAWSARVRLLAKINRRLEISSGEWAAIRSEVFERDDYTCQYCHQRGVRLECDHVIPVCLGGKTELTNLVTSCRCCNRAKGAKPLGRWEGQRHA